MRLFLILAAFPAMLACALGNAPTPPPSFGREQAIAVTQIFLFEVSRGTHAPSPALAAAAQDIVDNAGSIRGTWDAIKEPDQGAWLVSVQVEGRADPVEFRVFEATLSVELVGFDASATE
ncbi:MAG: hypothetical protein ABID84_01965 [Chloroflexota bacterium]